MIGTANGRPIGITGLGVHVPERVMTNDDLEQFVDTTDEWIVERTGIRERRIASPEEALTDIAAPAARAALADAGVEASSIDLIIVATVTPDMMFPTTSALLADALGMPDAAAYDLLAGCTGFMYAIAQAYGMVASGLSKRALVVGGDVLSKILDWDDRSTLVLFGDGAGAVVMEPVGEGGFLGFELGADGGGGEHLWLPGSGSRHFEDGDKLVKMNGREVFKFATRVMVSSAEKVLAECDLSVDDVDVYVPHQANKRIIDHAAKKLGIPEEKVVVNVDRYGNTSSGSIPLALADAAADGRLRDGELVLMTGMGAGLTWGSALIEWTNGRSCVSKVAFCSPARARSRPAWAARSPRPCPRRWRCTKSAARPPGSTSRPLLRRAARGARRHGGAAAGARRDEPRDPRGAPRRAASSPTSSSATRSASSPRSAPPSRIGAAEAIALVRERGLAMAEAARRAPARWPRSSGSRTRWSKALCRKIARRVAGELQLPRPDRRLRRGRRRRGVLRRGREPRRPTSGQAEGLRGVPQPARRARGRPARPAVERIRFADPRRRSCRP